jgi:hypothetical protein
MRLRRTLCTATLAAATTLLVTVPAQAAPGDAVAAGDAGSVSILRDGVAVEAGPIAPCRTDGPATGSVGETVVPAVASFTNSTATCTIDDAGELASVVVTGGAFRFDALREHGGPRLRLSSYTARCDTTRTGSTSNIEFAGLSGVAVPADLPANYVVTVPGVGEDAPPVATVTFNEVLLPSPVDGSMTVHLMHVRMFPEGGPVTGDAYVGTVHCAPAD